MTVTVVFKGDPVETEVAVCEASDAVRDWVTVKADTDPSGKSVVGKVDTTVHSEVPVIGVITQKLSDTLCVVQKSGNTSIFSGLSLGRKYWLTASGMSTEMPKAATGLVYTHGVGKAVGVNKFLVQIDTTIYGRDDQ